MQIWLIGLILLAFVSYSVIPTYYHKLINPKVIRKLTDEKRIALTFDDGPDERYTGALLDILKDNSVQATFFIVAKKADAHPDLVNRMINEGHEIALHSFEHANGLLKGYRYTKRDFEQCARIIKKHGWHVRYFRPPWGHSNVFTAYFAKQHNWKLATWNVMAQDWKQNTTSEEILTKLLNRVKSGSVICLHDSGGADNAPERTLQALRRAIPLLKAKGLKFSPLERI